MGHLLLHLAGLFFVAFAAGHAWWWPRRPRWTMLALVAAAVLFAVGDDGLAAVAVLLGGFTWAALMWRRRTPPLSS